MFFEVSDGNPHDQDTSYLACYYWEIDHGVFMEIHSRHYLNETAAQTYLKNACGLLPGEVTELLVNREIHIGEPPIKPNLTRCYSELGYWFYQTKPKGEKVNEVV